MSFFSIAFLSISGSARIAGHSSILMSSRYVHPTSERLETAVAKLDQYNQRKEEEAERKQETARATAS
jgi:hypothetical protein